LWTVRCLIALPFVAVAGWIAVRGDGSTAVWVLLAYSAIWVASVADAIVMLPAAKKLEAAIKKGSVLEARRRYDELARVAGARWAGSVGPRIALSSILLGERKYAPAREVLVTIPCDGHRLGARHRLAIRSNLALATLGAGDPSAAVDIACDALSSVQSSTPKAYEAIARTVLGSSYVAAGRYEEAIPALEFGLVHGRIVDRAACAFELGQAFAALGRTTEAREMYTRACETAPNARSGKLARERLAVLRPYRS
jgi:tetratricopeptide (TPR) repeat protein